MRSDVRAILALLEAAHAFIVTCSSDGVSATAESAQMNTLRVA